MIHEFMTVRTNDCGTYVDDEPCAILMDQVESIYPSTMNDHIGCTHLMLKSSDQYTIRMAYAEVLDIWRTCIEPININQ